MFDKSEFYFSEETCCRSGRNSDDYSAGCSSMEE